MATWRGNVRVQTKVLSTCCFHGCGICGFFLYITSVCVFWFECIYVYNTFIYVHIDMNMHIHTLNRR